MDPKKLGVVTYTLEAAAAMDPMKLGVVTYTGCEAESQKYKSFQVAASSKQKLSG